jgi:hypothetical protein
VPSYGTYLHKLAVVHIQVSFVFMQSSNVSAFVQILVMLEHNFSFEKIQLLS